MNSHSLLARIHPHRSPDRLGFLHRFSDSALHTCLLVVLLVLATLALAKIIDTMTLTIWQLEPVLVQGQTSTPPVIIYGRKR